MCIILQCIMNPFRYGEVVTGDDFCPRPNLVRQLRGHLEAGQNVVVLGERRMGKTSLIFETARRVRGLRLIYAQLWAVKSVEDIASRLLRAITTMQTRESSFLERVARSLSHLRPRIEFDPRTGQPSVTVTPGTKLSPSGLQGVFDFLEELGRQHRIAVALDEFQDVRGLAEADTLLGDLRARIQQHRGVSYVFAGSVRHELERIFRDPSSPFFKALRPLEVNGLPHNEFRAFLEDRFARGHRKVPDSSYAQIFELAEESPSDVQQLCAAIWDTSDPRQTIDAARLAAALAYIFATERKGYEAQVKNLTSIQVRLLKALARVGGQRPQSKEFLQEAGIPLPASAKRALTRLMDLEIIGGPMLQHRFFDPFFKQWVLRQF